MSISYLVLGGIGLLLAFLFVYRLTQAEGDAAVPVVVPAPAPTPRIDAAASPQLIKTFIDVVRDEKALASMRLNYANSLIERAKGSPEALEAEAALPSIKAAAEKERLAAEEAKTFGAWQYRSTDDPMTSKTSYFATLQSENTLSFDFPYQGEQYGTLTMRNHPKQGRDVIISIEKGQILCRSYSDCTIGVRFDDDAAVTYTGIEAADNSSEYFFLETYSKFKEKMKTAKRLRVQFMVHQEGKVTLEFNVKGFQPEQLH